MRGWTGGQSGGGVGVCAVVGGAVVWLESAAVNPSVWILQGVWKRARAWLVKKEDRTVSVEGSGAVGDWVAAC